MTQRFAFDALERFVRAGRPCWSSRDTAAVFGVNADTIRAWRRHGLSWVRADRLAVAAGVHPANVWPTWFDLDNEHEPFEPAALVDLADHPKAS